MLWYLEFGDTMTTIWPPIGALLGYLGFTLATISSLWVPFGLQSGTKIALLGQFITYLAIGRLGSGTIWASAGWARGTGRLGSGQRPAGLGAAAGWARQLQKIEPAGWARRLLILKSVHPHGTLEAKSPVGQ